MRDRILKSLARYHALHPYRMLIVVCIITVVLGFLATRLSVTMQWSDLLPAGDKRTIEFNRVIEEFKSATNITIVVQGPEKRIKEFADELAPRLVAAEITSGDTVRKLIQRVDYKMEVDFMKRHGLMLIKADDLKNMKEIFTNPNLTDLIKNINDSMEKEYVGRSESISTREKEDRAFTFLDGIEHLVRTMNYAAEGKNVSGDDAKEAVERLVIGEPYFLSYDKTTLVLNAVPTFPITDIDLVVRGTEKIEKIVDELCNEYPDVNAGVTGMMAVSHDEIVYSEKSLGYTSVIAAVAILILLIFSLRMWVAPIFAMINLLIGILWAVGVTAVVVGKLNIMTQMMSVVLLGLGIDFSIHLISGFTERRAAGLSIVNAMEETFLISGKGVVTGALTTAFAFLTMIISSSRGMKEMGIVTGMGLVAVLFASFLVLPIFLVFRERRIDRKRERKGELKFIQRDISFKFLGSTGEWLSKHYVFTIVCSVALSVFFAWHGFRITFDQNYMNIEPKGLESIALQDTVIEKFDLSTNYALVSASSIEESRSIAETYRKMGSVAMAEDISQYIPSEKEQKSRSIYIREISRRVKASKVRDSFQMDELTSFREQIERLRMNIMELQDMAFLGGQDRVDNKCKRIVGDPDNPEEPDLMQNFLKTLESNRRIAVKGLSRFQRQFGANFKEIVSGMCSTRPIKFEELPESIVDRFCNRDRDLFLVTVYASGSLWKDAAFLHRFSRDLESVSERATGMAPVFCALLDIIGRDGRNAMILTLIIVFLLLWLDFRKVRYGLIAMIPLAVGVLWMIGLMKLTSQQFTVMNVMGLPMIIGIGIDDGVHIVHRWIAEGRGKVRVVFASTGKAILLTTLTTMLAFGSLVFSIWRGFAQLGGALFVGVGGCFLTTVIILAGIIGLNERKSKDEYFGGTKNLKL